MIDRLKFPQKFLQNFRRGHTIENHLSEGDGHEGSFERSKKSLSFPIQTYINMAEDIHCTYSWPPNLRQVYFFINLGVIQYIL